MADEFGNNEDDYGGLTPIGSSHLAAVGHSRLTGKLTVQFTDGQVYEYDDVPREVYEGLFSASSVGQYFAENIRLEYNYRKIG